MSNSMSPSDLVLSDVHILNSSSEKIDSKVGPYNGTMVARGSSLNYVTQFEKCEEHALETEVPDCGLQIWNGALLMCDFVLSNRDLFQGECVLELGSGVGISSLALAYVGATVFATVVYNTDLNLALFSTIQRYCKAKDTSTHIYLSLEHRVNFLIECLSPSSPAYEEFSTWLNTSESCGWTVQQIDNDTFSHNFPYEKTAFLELWHLVAP